jgi:hypothetical protein
MMDMAFRTASLPTALLAGLAAGLLAATIAPVVIALGLI